MKFKVEDSFEVAGRGTALVVKEATEFPVAKPLRAILFRPDGTQLSAEAFKEFVLFRQPEVFEKEAFVVQGVKRSEVPDGCFVEIAAE